MAIQLAIGKIPKTVKILTNSWQAAMLLTLCALVLMPAHAAAQHTYYISKSSGSDSNSATQAQSKSTPWAHLPGMPSCSSNCAAYNPVAGDQFILKGGDTWGSSDQGVNWTRGGTSSSKIYIGVDQTWYSGSSWTRPIFNCQSTACGVSGGAASQFWVSGSYVTIDNIEFTGVKQSGGSQPQVATYSDHTEVEHCYFHGWSRASGETDNGSAAAISTNISNGTTNVAGASFHDNVIDGSDTTEDMWNGIIHGDTVYNNVIRYVVSGLLGLFNDVHSNLIEYPLLSYAGDHANELFIFDPLNGTNVWAYSNVVRNDIVASGAEIFWLNGNGGCSGCTTYAYNNVIYNAGRGIDVGAHPSSGSTGTYYIYNNTIESGGGACVGNGEASPRSTTNFANNQCINSSTVCDGTGTTCNNQGGNLSQTLAQANAAGYLLSEVYAYSPISILSPTVGKGNNLSSACSGNVAALCSDTNYPTYNSSNHTVALRTTIARPASGAWDIGAFQFQASGTSNPPPNPPSSLSATVQ